MAIAYVDGKRFRKAIVAAAQRLLEVQERLNRINVFPVPDGDTGTNMALTLKSIADSALDAGDATLGDLSESLADRALLGARGNSGAVLAQFFQGVAASFSGRRSVDVQSFAAAMEKAVSQADSAFVQPVEGTILSVMRAWASHLKKAAPKVGDFTTLWKGGLDAAERALKHTPEQLEVLARAGVVDAGAQGFYDMLQGVQAFMESGQLEMAHWQEGVASPDTAVLEEVALDLDRPFCTECLVQGTRLDAKALRTALGALGDSLIVAGNASKLRIHIHTDVPEKVFAEVGKRGRISHKKADDMREQSRDRLQNPSKFALITDSSCDLPPEFLIRHNIRVVPLNLYVGSKTYLDRITITSDELYDMMASRDLGAKTSQPSPLAFSQAYALAAEQHDRGLALLLSNALSGTYQAGLSAAMQEKRIQVEVWDSRTIAGGLGFLVELAANAVAEGCDREEVLRRLEIARPHVGLAVSLQTMKYLRRSGRVNRLRGWLATVLNLVPIVGLDEVGKAKILGKAKPGAKSREKLFHLVAAVAADCADFKMRVIHAGAAEQAQELAERFQSHLGIEAIEVLPVSPTLGSHFGPGTVAVTWMAFPPGVKTW